MANAQVRDLTLIEKLKTEVRFCQECSLEVRHPLIERCPRCYALLPHIRLGCQGCAHRFQCPINEQSGEEVLATTQTEPHR